MSAMANQETTTADLLRTMADLLPSSTTSSNTTNTNNTSSTPSLFSTARRVVVWRAGLAVL